MFTTQLTVRLYDTDAAGILYFGNQFRFAHDAFEQLLDSEGLNFQQLFDKEPYLFVIVHAESSYMSQLHVGDKITIEVTASRIGSTSFTLDYAIKKQDSTLAGTAKTVHVCIGKQTRQKQDLPENIRQILTKYQL